MVEFQITPYKYISDPKKKYIRTVSPSSFSSQSGWHFPHDSIPAQVMTLLSTRNGPNTSDAIYSTEIKKVPNDASQHRCPRHVFKHTFKRPDLLSPLKEATTDRRIPGIYLQI